MPKKTEDLEKIIEEGRRVLTVERDAIGHSIGQLGESFAHTVVALEKAISSGGKVIVSGVGKSGIVARKVAATLASTGSMAVFLHPTEAIHGDLGVVGAQDVLLVFSHSGSSPEMLQLLPAAKELCAGAYGVLGNPSGALAPLLKEVISSSVSREACSDNLAPTASSTLALALGDALAMALKARRGFGPDHFAKFHPGGSLGKRLTIRVQDLMHKEGDMGLLPPDSTMDEVVIALTKYRQSGICIVEGKAASGRAKLIGVVTEGDIRRALSQKEKFFGLRARDVMTKKPTTVGPAEKAYDALVVMEQRDGQLSFLPVVDEDGGCVGVIRVHDLVLAGLA